MKISIIIPTYKNHERFLANLERNLDFMKDAEIIIVNDNPSVSLKNELELHKNITLIENKSNLGFGESVNRGVQKSHAPFLVLLNDDVILTDDSYQKIPDIFTKNPDLFAVGFVQKEKDNSIVGANRLYWKNGMLFHAKTHHDRRQDNGWAEGGACMIDRSKFDQLGGFDPAYSPFYWEDIDLSYRAWKSGYRILFDPSVKVIHHHESTIGAYFDRSFIKTVAFRNQFIFIWKNITDGNLRWQHFLLLPYNLLYYAVKGEWLFWQGFIHALKYLKEIKKIPYPIADQTVLKHFNP